MYLSKSLMYSIGVEMPALSYPSYLFLWMKIPKPPWKWAVYHDLVEVSVQVKTQNQEELTFNFRKSFIWAPQKTAKVSVPVSQRGL